MADEFRENVKKVAKVLESTRATSVPLEHAASLLPTLKEWDELARYVGRRLKGRRKKRLPE